MNRVDQAVLEYLKSQQTPVTFDELLAATGADIVALSVSVVGLEAAGRITSEDGEYPRYQLAQVVPLGYSWKRRGEYVCKFCVRGCDECPLPELPEEAIYY
jgi:hypothetical protein